MILYWFDTNCFSLLIDGNMPISVEREVFQNVANKKAYIVISPFTFYEVLKGENSIAKIKNLYDKLMLIPDFYVANLFNVFEMKQGLLDGKRYIDDMKMGEIMGEMPIEYAWFRDGFKKMLGVPYANYFVQYAKMAAIVFMISLECDEKGRLNQRTINKISYIEQFDKIGNNKNTFESIFSEFFIHYDYKSVHPEEDLGKSGMQLQVLDFVNLLLNAAESKQQLIDEKVPYSGIIFNERLVNNSHLFNYSLIDFHKYIKGVSSKTNNALSLRAIFDKYIKGRIGGTFFKEMFEDLICCKGILYTKLNNDFIDGLNIFFAATFFSGNDNYYFTNDRYWLAFIKKHKNKNLFNGNVLQVRYDEKLEGKF